MEEALYEIVLLRQFTRLPITGALPDETNDPQLPEPAGNAQSGHADVRGGAPTCMYTD